MILGGEGDVGLLLHPRFGSERSGNRNLANLVALVLREGDKESCAAVDVLVV
jgi:hypothetical protein